MTKMSEKWNLQEKMNVLLSRLSDRFDIKDEICNWRKKWFRVSKRYRLHPKLSLVAQNRCMMAKKDNET